MDYKKILTAEYQEIGKGAGKMLWAWSPTEYALARQLERMEMENARLREIEKAAQIIFDVTSAAWDRANPMPCPHGNIPAYPAHAWWCDECWFHLKDALVVLSNEVNNGQP